MYEASWEPSRAVANAVFSALAEEGDAERFILTLMAEDAPFAHLKVMVVDEASAYIGSANITAAGLAGRNLELGVLVKGPQAKVIERVLDLYIVN